MKFLVDNQLPAALAKWLTQNGWEAKHVLDTRLNDSDDTEIWEYARKSGCVVISKDEDFSNRAALQSDVQVVWVRLGNCRNTALMAAFERNMPSLISALRGGASVVELWGP
jgi:predicted nuclease of predicted toxin-antitoxin system